MITTFPDPSLLPRRSWSRAAQRARDPGKDSRIPAVVPKKGGGLSRRKNIKRWKLLTFTGNAIFQKGDGSVWKDTEPDPRNKFARLCYLCWPASKHARQDQPRSQDLQVGVQKLIQAWYQRTCAVPGIWTLPCHCSSQNQWVSGFPLTDHWFRPSVRYPHFFLRYPLVIQHSY